jgi:hypothetical protein
MKVEGDGDLPKFCTDIVIQTYLRDKLVAEWFGYYDDQ